MNIFVSKLGVIVSTATICIFAAFTQVVMSRAHGPAGTAVSLSNLPTQIGGWSSVEAEPLNAKSQDILKLDQYVRRLYKNAAGESVFVYIGYWQKQSGEHQAAKHSPLMCLPANGWKISSPEQRSVPLASGAQSARQLAGIIQDHSVLFYYWFFSGEETYVDETDALFRIIRETVLKGRSDGGIVELSIDLGSGAGTDPKRAEEVMQSFVKEFVPALNAVVGTRN